MIPTKVTEHESSLLWKFVALKAKPKIPKVSITPVGNTRIPLAEEVMKFLISQWEETRFTGLEKTKDRMAWLDKSDVNKPPHNFPQEYAGTKKRSRFRIDREGFNSGHGPHEDKSFANIQGQVDTASVFNVQIRVQKTWKLDTIKAKMTESLDTAKTIWMVDEGTFVID